MKLYENAYPSAYEEIKTWYPVWYWQISEMDALWRVFGKQLDEVQKGIIQAIDNNFIDFADAETISKLEVFLRITYDGSRTLVERRNTIKAFLLSSLSHIGRPEIKELLAVFTDGEIDVELVGGTIQITVTRDFRERFNLYDAYLVLNRKIPAHLQLGFIDNFFPVSNNYVGFWVYDGAAVRLKMVQD